MRNALLGRKQMVVYVTQSMLHEEKGGRVHNWPDLISNTLHLKAIIYRLEDVGVRRRGDSIEAVNRKADSTT